MAYMYVADIKEQAILGMKCYSFDRIWKATCDDEYNNTNSITAIFYLSRYTSRSLRDEFENMMAVIEKRGSPPPLFITIFIGANDACLTLDGTYVPLDEFEEHIRYYVNSILEHPAAKGTKIILISTPPVDVPRPAGDDSLLEDQSAAAILRSVAVAGSGHKTWESKRQFAQKIVQIGKEFEEKTNLVAVLDFWTVITTFACHAEGKSKDEVFDELDLDERLPGSGMPGAKEFGSSFFTDRLHFGKSVCNPPAIRIPTVSSSWAHMTEQTYEVLGYELLDLVLTKWPELGIKNFPIRVCISPSPLLLLTITK